MQQERDPFGELVGDAVEGRAAAGVGGRVGDAPVRRRRVARKLGTDLADPVAQA